MRAKTLTRLQQRVIPQQPVSPKFSSEPHEPGSNLNWTQSSRFRFRLLLNWTLGSVQGSAISGSRQTVQNRVRTPNLVVIAVTYNLSIIRQQHYFEGFKLIYYSLLWLFFYINAYHISFIGFLNQDVAPFRVISATQPLDQSHLIIELCYWLH